MAAIYLVGTADTKADELMYLQRLIKAAGGTVKCVDVGTRAPACKMDICATSVAGYHPDGA